MDKLLKDEEPVRSANNYYYMKEDDYHIHWNLATVSESFLED